MNKFSKLCITVLLLMLALTILARTQAAEEEQPRRWKWIPPEEDAQSKEADFLADTEHIVVQALINDSVEAALVLDTGASTVHLSAKIAQELGISTYATEDDLVEVQVADGRKVKAKYVTLDSLAVQETVAQDVAAVILEENENIFADGLLGMSFLKNFNFEIDNDNKKLILRSK